jgi:hypothetical protein
MKNKEEKKQLTGQATDEQIAMWKNLYKKVYEVEVDGSVCYLRKPDRKTISAATSLGASDPVRYAEVMLENCWLGGDDDIKTDNDKFFGVTSQLDKLTKVAKASLKEL